MKDYVDERWRPIMTYNGLPDFDALWRLDAQWFEEPNRRRGGWSGTARCELLLPGGGVRAVFLKRQENHQTFSWRRPFGGVPTFEREFRRIMRYLACGIPALEPVYFAARRIGRDHRAILITAELTGFVSLKELGRRWLVEGAPPRAARRRILGAVAGLLRGMHDHGIQHNCFFPKHVMVRIDEAGRVEVRVIDLEKSRWRLLRTLCALRDLDTLNRHASNWSRGDRLWFLKSYLRIGRITPYARWLWRQLAARAQKASRQERRVRLDHTDGGDRLSPPDAVSPAMQLAFCLFKYFPYGGLQRDFLRIAQACQARGHAVRVYTLQWEGDLPAGFEVLRVPVRALSNHRRYAKFARWMQRDLADRPVDRVIGFNKMPGLDLYYSADPCYEEKVRTLRGPLYRLSGRYRHFAAFERAVFAPDSRTRILMISAQQQPLFVKHYGTPPERFYLLPPGIATDRRAPANAEEIRRNFRHEFGLGADDLLLVQIGSGFKTKGLDRSLKALAALPTGLKARTRLIAIGQDEPRPFLRQIRSIGLEKQVDILKGRDDIPRFLLGADLLIHPAYNENTGTVLLEALVAGLPVLTTAACGYAHYIEDADAGRVISLPFDQNALDKTLVDMLTDDAARRQWHDNGLAFADRADLYSLPERAADVILRTTT